MKSFKFKKQEATELQDVKLCVCCNTVKPLTEFYTSPRMRDGYRSLCKDCSKKASAEYQRKKREAERNEKTVSAPVKNTVSAVIRRDDPTNPLANFTPRELIAELRLRGYVGELEVTTKIRV